MAEFPEFRHNKEDKQSSKMTDKCIFGCDEPVGVFFLPGGCACFPDDQLQLLCEPHMHKAADLDGIYWVIYWGA
jgi:hypothetical protein